MVKHLKISNPSLTIRIKLPLKTLLFWRQKIKDYAEITKKMKKEQNIYQTIYFSKKYPKIGFIELYKIIKKLLKKKLNYTDIRNKEELNHLNNNKDYSIKEEDITSINENEITNKNNQIGRELSEDIKNINEINFSHIKHYFESKLNINSNKYENCFVESIYCYERKKELFSFQRNKKIYFISSKLFTSSSNNIKKNIKNKIRFITQLVNNNK